MKLTRRELINHSMGVFLASHGAWPEFNPGVSLTQSQSPSGNDFYLRIVKANDARVPGLIESVNAAQPRRIAVRRVAGDLQGLAAAFCAPEYSGCFMKSALNAVRAALYSVVATLSAAVNVVTCVRSAVMVGFSCG